MSSQVEETKEVEITKEFMETYIKMHVAVTKKAEEITRVLHNFDKKRYEEMSDECYISFDKASNELVAGEHCGYDWDWEHVYLKPEMFYSDMWKEDMIEKRKAEEEEAKRIKEAKERQRVIDNEENERKLYAQLKNKFENK